MPFPRLILITDWELPRDELLSRLRAALSLGPQVAVQHRHPSAPARRFLEEGRLLAELCEEFGNPLFVNGYLDVALLLGAHLHLPANGFLPTDARPHLPSGRWISAAVHNLAEARRSAGADLTLISPVFAPGSKPPTSPPIGPQGFRALAASVSCPAMALGGIQPSNAKEVLGAAGFAVISAVLRSDDPADAARRLLDS